MDMHNPLISSMKQKLEKVFKNENFPLKRRSTGNNSAEKLPPRLNMKGMTVAARVMGNEIREFAMRNTGKDLAQIRNNERRKQFISKISNIKIAFTNNEAKYSYILLACNHNSNFTSSLSPEGEDYSVSDSEFKKTPLRKLVARYHKKCIQDIEIHSTSIGKRRGYYDESTVIHKKEVFTNDKKEKVVVFCNCHSSITDEKQKNYQSKKYLSCWQHKGITEMDLDNYCNINRYHFENGNKLKELTLNEKEGWKEFVRNEKCIVFRRLLENDVYEYRVQAAFFDITASHLFQVQLDGEYRKSWDEYILDFNVVDNDKYTKNELVHWVTKCPYPFATREYIYLRKHKVDEKKKLLVLYQKATNDTSIPKDDSIQRVDTYTSKIIIKPHDSDFNKNGCDFLLTYYDDPKMRLPTRIIDLAARKGIQDSVNRMHAAAQKLNIEEC